MESSTPYSGFVHCQGSSGGIDESTGMTIQNRKGAMVYEVQNHRKKH